VTSKVGGIYCRACGDAATVYDTVQVLINKPSIDNDLKKYVTDATGTFD